MAAHSQRRALGALFLLLSLFFAGVAIAAGAAGLEGDAGVVGWAIAVAAAAIALWLGGLAARALHTSRVN